MDHRSKPVCFCQKERRNSHLELLGFFKNRCVGFYGQVFGDRPVQPEAGGQFGRCLTGR